MLDSSLDGNFLLHPIGGGRILYANANWKKSFDSPDAFENFYVHPHQQDDL